MVSAIFVNGAPVNLNAGSFTVGRSRNHSLLLHAKATKDIIDKRWRA